MPILGNERRNLFASPLTPVMKRMGVATESQQTGQDEGTAAPAATEGGPAGKAAGTVMPASVFEHGAGRARNGGSEARLTSTAKTTRGNTVAGGGYMVNPNSVTSGIDTIMAGLYTSPEQEERMRKASLARQRILAVGDAIRHIGNIVNTVKGAPSQQFTPIVEAEGARYRQEKALRDAGNLRVMSYQQAKAAQDAKQKQWEAEQKAKADQWNATFMYNASRDAAKLAEDKRQYDETLALNKRKADDTKAATEARLKQQEKYQNRMASIAGMNAQTNRMRANAYINRTNSGGGRSGGRNNVVSLRGKNGFYSREMSADERNSFYNQTYDELVRRGIIRENDVLAGLPADLFGQKHVSQSAMRRAVDDALMTHPEVGDWLMDEYEFDFDPRATEEAVQGTSMPNANIWTPTWSTYGQQRGDPFADRVATSNNSEKNHKSSPFE